MNVHESVRIKQNTESERYRTFPSNMVHIVRELGAFQLITTRTGLLLVYIVKGKLELARLSLINIHV